MGRNAEDINQLVNRRDIIAAVMGFIWMAVNLAFILGTVPTPSGFEIPFYEIMSAYMFVFFPGDAFVHHDDMDTQLHNLGVTMLTCLEIIRALFAPSVF